MRGTRTMPSEVYWGICSFKSIQFTLDFILLHKAHYKLLCKLFIYRKCIWIFLVTGANNTRRTNVYLCFSDREMNNNKSLQPQHWFRFKDWAANSNVEQQLWYTYFSATCLSFTEAISRYSFELGQIIPCILLLLTMLDSKLRANNRLLWNGNLLVKSIHLSD